MKEPTGVWIDEVASVDEETWLSIDKLKTFTLADLIGKTVSIQAFKGEEDMLVYATDEKGIVYLLKEDLK